MTYIDYLNAFHHITKSNYIPGNARLLYYSLLSVFNEAGWPASIQVDNYRLMSMVDTRTERVAISARDVLVGLGLIGFIRGKKRCPNTYYLFDFTQQKVSEIDSVSVSVSGSETVSVSGSVSVPETVSHIKTKTKKKTKNNILSSDEERVRPRKRGMYGWVRLTDGQYSKLVADFGEVEVRRAIAYVDESAQSNGNKNKWKDWNLVVRKCIRDGWGLRGAGKQQKPIPAPQRTPGGEKERLLKLVETFGKKDENNETGDSRAAAGTE